MAAVQNKPKVEAKGRGGNSRLSLWKKTKRFFKASFERNGKKPSDSESQDYDFSEEFESDTESVPSVKNLNNLESERCNEVDVHCESTLSNGITVVDCDQSDNEYIRELEDEKWNEKVTNIELIAQIVAYIQRKDKSVADTIQEIKSEILQLKEYYEEALHEKISLDKETEENEKRQNFQFQKESNTPQQPFENSQLSQQSSYFQSTGNLMPQSNQYQRYPPPEIQCSQQLAYAPNQRTRFKNPPPQRNTCSNNTAYQQTNFRCERCNKTGHNVTNCVARLPAKYIKCYNCQLLGHIAKNCRTPSTYYCDNYRPWKLKPAVCFESHRKSILKASRHTPKLDHPSIVRKKEFCHNWGDKRNFRLSTKTEIGENGIKNALEKQITLKPRPSSFLRIVVEKEGTKNKEIEKDSSEPNKVGLRENGREMTQSAKTRISSGNGNESKNRFKGTEKVFNMRKDNIDSVKTVETEQVEKLCLKILSLSKNSETVNTQKKNEHENNNRNEEYIENKMDKSIKIEVPTQQRKLFKKLKTGIGDTKITFTGNEAVLIDPVNFSKTNENKTWLNCYTQGESSLSKLHCFIR